MEISEDMMTTLMNQYIHFQVLYNGTMLITQTIIITVIIICATYYATGYKRQSLIQHDTNLEMEDFGDAENLSEFRDSPPPKQAINYLWVGVCRQS